MRRKDRTESFFWVFKGSRRVEWFGTVIVFTLLSELMIEWPLYPCLSPRFLFVLYLEVSHKWAESVSDFSFFLNPLRFLWDITYRQKDKKVIGSCALKKRLLTLFLVVSRSQTVNNHITIAYTRHGQKQICLWTAFTFCCAVHSLWNCFNKLM